MLTIPEIIIRPVMTIITTMIRILKVKIIVKDHNDNNAHNSNKKEYPHKLGCALQCFAPGCGFSK